jgi:hypothetical protein
MTRLPALGAIVLLVGCGSTSGFRAAAPTTRTLDWHDESGPPQHRMIVVVHRLIVRRDGWSVDAKVTNGTDRTLVISRVHRPYQTKFGIAETPGDERAVPPQRFATRFLPPLRRRLAPGDSWEGVFSGPGRLPRARDLRVVFGTFFAIPPVNLGGRRYTRFDIFTDESVRLT